MSAVYYKPSRMQTFLYDTYREVLKNIRIENENKQKQTSMTDYFSKPK